MRSTSILYLLLLHSILFLMAAASRILEFDPRPGPITLNRGSKQIRRNITSAQRAHEIFRRQNRDPADFSWIKKWAAIGDSFSAGIGSGRLYSNNEKDIACSRYNQAWPAVVDRHLGPSIQNFQFTACSGDRTGGIFDQANGLSGDLDLVMFTAGGNDLCLADILKTCVFFFWGTEKGCTDVINKANENLRNILKSNIKEVLEALSFKVKDDGIVVVLSYAEYFDAETDVCTSDENWSFPWAGDGIFSALPLTKERRRIFNKLVLDTNAEIKKAVEEVAKDSKIKYKLGYANWNGFAQKVKGQYCEETSSGAYPDPKVPNLHFFKKDTRTSERGHDELRKRDVAEKLAIKKRLSEEWEASIYRSKFYVSANPGAVALHKLDKRTPAPPGCPSDGSLTNKIADLFGIGLADKYGKFFHPNERGHRTMAGFAINKMIKLRAEVLGVGGPDVCELPTKVHCNGLKGNEHSYVHADRLDNSYKKFCQIVSEKVTGSVGWGYEENFDRETPEEHKYKFQMGEASKFDRDECEKAFGQLIHGCDIPNDDNPRNFKFGGEYKRGEYTYTVETVWKTRPHISRMKKTYGTCDGWYKFWNSEFYISGAGWASSDWGQETLLKAARDCVGGGVTSWYFKYHENAKDRADGYEWESYFKTPIWVRGRCFGNNHVQSKAGGNTDGCGGNDW